MYKRETQPREYAQLQFYLIQPSYFPKLLYQFTLPPGVFKVFHCLFCILGNMWHCLLNLLFLYGFVIAVILVLKCLLNFFSTNEYEIRSAHVLICITLITTVVSNFTYVQWPFCTFAWVEYPLMTFAHLATLQQF